MNSVVLIYKILTSINFIIIVLGNNQSYSSAYSIIKLSRRASDETFIKQVKSNTNISKKKT